MKFNQSILAAVLGLSMAGLANAGTVYLTGSTACRGNVYSAMTTAGEVFTATPATTLYQGGSGTGLAGSGANYMAFTGTLVGNTTPTTIQCSWSGSEAGIADCASNTAEQFIASSLLDGNDHGTNVPASFDTGNVQLAFGDNAQSFSRAKKPVINTNAEIGVITFEWNRNKGVWTGSNVSDSQIKQAMSGYCKLAVFTGNAADTTSYVYVSGRDSGSGTRVNAFGESGFGILSSPNQIELDGTGHMIDVDLSGNYIGDWGFSSGGTLTKTLNTDTSAILDPIEGTTGYSVIAYASVGDSANDTAGAQLSYNGVTFSAAAVKEGTYTFWGNEYVFQGNGVTAGTEANKAYNNLALNVKNHADGTKLIKLTDMHCARSGPTSDPVHN